MALRLRRGTDAERQLITHVEGELIYTTDTKLLYAGDGITAGGTLVTGAGGGARDRGRADQALWDGAGRTGGNLLKQSSGVDDDNARYVVAGAGQRAALRLSRLRCRAIHHQSRIAARGGM